MTAHTNTTDTGDQLVPAGETCIVDDMPNGLYHAHPHVSKSNLDKLAVAPALYRYGLDNPSLPTDAMRTGTILHTAVLEPDRFKFDYVAAPVCDRRTSEGKALWSSFLLTAGDREVVTADEYERALAMRDAVYAHPAARKALTANRWKIEASIFGELEGVPVRCRPDMLRTDHIVVDVKTTKNASPDEFAKSVANYRYHVQSAFYGDLIERVTGQPTRAFIFIAVETVPPYLVAVYVASEPMTFKGRELYRRDLETYRKCAESGEWPGYSDVPLTLDLPRWAM